MEQIHYQNISILLHVSFNAALTTLRRSEMHTRLFQLSHAIKSVIVYFRLQFYSGACLDLSISALDWSRTPQELKVLPMQKLIGFISIFSSMCMNTHPYTNCVKCTTVTDTRAKYMKRNTNAHNQQTKLLTWCLRQARVLELFEICSLVFEGIQLTHGYVNLKNENISLEHKKNKKSKNKKNRQMREKNFMMIRLCLALNLTKRLKQQYVWHLKERQRVPGGML